MTVLFWLSLPFLLAALAVAATAATRGSAPPNAPDLLGSALVPVSSARVVDTRPCDFRLGTVRDTKHWFTLSEEMTQTHGLILGRTGSGKSKLAELWMRQLLISGHGFTCIDPKGDLCEDLFAFVAYLKATGDDVTWRKVHYVEPSFEMVFSYDPFTFAPAEPIPPEYREAARAAWLSTKVDRVIEVLQRKQGQAGVEGFPRLQRVLRDVLLAVGTAVDDQGKHLPLADALVLLDVYHPRHDAVFARVAPFLEGDVRADFMFWHQLRRSPQQLLVQIESSLNRLRSFLSGVVRSIFCEQVHSLDFRRMSQNREVLLVNLRETDYFSADQAQAIGGLFLHEELSNAASTPRHLRQERFVFVDEASEFVGPDIGRCMRQARAQKLRLFLLAQGLSSFRKGDVDLTEVVCQEPGVLISFEQRWPCDIETLSEILFRNNLNFTELYQVMDRPDGQDLMSMDEYSENWSWSENWGQGVSLSKTHTLNRTVTDTRSWQETWSRQQSQGTTAAQADSRGRTLAQGEGQTQGQSPVVKDYMPHSMIPTLGANKTRSQADQQSHSDSLAVNQAESHGEGGGQGGSHAVASGSADGNGRTDSRTTGGARNEGGSVSHKTVLVPRTREEWHPTGRLRYSIDDQFQWFRTELQRQQGRQAAARLPGIPEGFFFDVAEVKEKWTTEEKFLVIELMKKRLQALHPYHVVPRVGAGEQEKRLAAFLTGPGNVPVDVPADGARPAGAAPPDELGDDEIA